jgi:hypothetical protein
LTLDLYKARTTAALAAARSIKMESCRTKGCHDGGAVIGRHLYSFLSSLPHGKNHFDFLLTFGYLPRF